LLVVLAVVIAWTLLSRCPGGDSRQAIRVEENRVVITNLTGQAWSDVEVWLNTWYRAQAPALEPGQRLEIPLRVFASGPGTQFDPRARGPVGILVSARAADGSDVELTWGDGRRR
jgi:hypothetical protein